MKNTNNIIELNDEVISKFKFRSFSNSKYFDLNELKEKISYLIEENNSKEYPDILRIYCGTDSKKRKFNTVFVSVVVFYYVGHYSKVFYVKNFEYRKMAKEERLFREAEYSVCIGLKINELCCKYEIPLIIHCDYSNEKQNFSNKIVQSALGYITSMGLEGEIKPKSFAASHCADKIIKKTRR